MTSRMDMWPVEWACVCDTSRMGFTILSFSRYGKLYLVFDSYEVENTCKQNIVHIFIAFDLSQSISKALVSVQIYSSQW